MTRDAVRRARGRHARRQQRLAGDAGAVEPAQAGLDDTPCGGLPGVLQPGAAAGGGLRRGQQIGQAGAALHARSVGGDRIAVAEDLEALRGRGQPVHLQARLDHVRADGPRQLLSERHVLHAERRVRRSRSPCRCCRRRARSIAGTCSGRRRRRRSVERVSENPRMVCDCPRVPSVASTRSPRQVVVGVVLELAAGVVLVDRRAPRPGGSSG